MVLPLWACITASHCCGMLLIWVWIYSWGMLFYSSTRPLVSTLSDKTAGFRARSHYPIMSQTCSVEFRSRLQTGHSSVVRLDSSRNALVSRAMWGRALPCCKRNLSLINGANGTTCWGEYPGYKWQQSPRGGPKYGVQSLNYTRLQPRTIFEKEIRPLNKIRLLVLSPISSPHSLDVYLDSASRIRTRWWRGPASNPLPSMHCENRQVAVALLNADVRVLALVLAYDCEYPVLRVIFALYNWLQTLLKWY